MPYVRLVLDDASRADIAGLARLMQDAATASFGEGSFLSQLDERAGLGCHPFHITLAGGLRSRRQGTDYTAEFVDGCLAAIAVSGVVAPRARFFRLHVPPRGGCVLLKVDSDTAEDVHRLARTVAAQFPGCNDWYAQEPTNLHCTVGTWNPPAGLSVAVARAWFVDQFQVPDGAFLGEGLEYETDDRSPNPPVRALPLGLPLGDADGKGGDVKDGSS